MRNRKSLPHVERRDIDSAEKPVITDEGKIRGLAIPFNSWTTIGFGPQSFRERIAPGAATKTLRESDLVYLDNHDPSRPIARKSADNLRAITTERGVEFEAEPIDTTYAQDFVKNVRAKLIVGNSFGFESVKEKWGVGADGVDERTILEMRLPEISGCTFPAYGDTELGMRDAYKIAIEKRDQFYGSRGTRAAKATYSDLTTCGECGATGQYGEFCGNCGEPMRTDDGYSVNEFCTSCGAPLDDSTRSSHVCIRAGDAPGNGKKPYGNVKYADPKNGKYPIDTEKHIKAAWAYINVQKNADEYPLNGVTLSSVKAKIKAAAKAAGIEITSDESDRMTETPEARDSTEALTAMQEALEHLRAGDMDSAMTVMRNHLDTYDGDDDDTEDSSGMVAHTNTTGAAVPIPRQAPAADFAEVVKTFAPDISEAYDIVRSEFPATAVTNKVLNLLHPFVSETSAEERERPKPESSTSGIAAGSDEGIALDLRFKDTRNKFRL